MATRNVKVDKTVVEQSATEVQPVQETTGSSEGTQATPEQPEGGEKELPVQSEQGSGEQTDGEGNTVLDSEGKEETVVQEGSGTGDQVTGEDQELDTKTEETYQAAKEVIIGMVDGALEESGILDEPKEKTEKRNKIASDVFSKHSARKTLYFTSDMIPFFEKSDAKKHAGTLKDDTVVTINKK